MNKKVYKRCIDCNSPISFQSKRCLPCFHLKIKGVKTPLDKYTGFREFIRRAKNRKNLDSLTLDDILDVWNNQKQICPYSGVKLFLPSYSEKNDPLFVASLDRIESDKPYTKGNIQFVSAAINYMKHAMTHEDTVKLCKLIAANWSDKNEF